MRAVLAAMVTALLAAYVPTPYVKYFSDISVQPVFTVALLW